MPDILCKKDLRAASMKRELNNPLRTSGQSQEDRNSGILLSFFVTPSPRESSRDTVIQWASDSGSILQQDQAPFMLFTQGTMRLRIFFPCFRCLARIQRLGWLGLADRAIEGLPREKKNCTFIVVRPYEILLFIFL
jgi:hypothetical protein